VTQEVVYNLNDEGDNHGEIKSEREAADGELRGDGEMPGGAVGMDGEAQEARVSLDKGPALSPAFRRCWRTSGCR